MKRTNAFHVPAAATDCCEADSESRPHGLVHRGCRRRRGATASGLVLGVTGSLLLIVATIQFGVSDVADFITGMFSSEDELQYLTTEAFRGEFVHEVLERGEIESSSNVEIRCEVRGRNSAGVSILEIVPEGTWVKPGDVVAKLDDSQLQQELIQQQIVASNSRSQVIEAQAALDGSRIALSEYEQGTFREAVEQQESALFVAQENERRAEEYLEYSKRLAERGYIPEAQLEADAFAVEKARKELGVAETRLNVLQTFTREKMITQLKADIDTAEARLEARQKTWELDKLRLEEIQEQIKHCVLLAPSAGQIVYANDQERRSSSGDLLIGEGKLVRERQVVARLPDPNRMRVVTRVHESRVSFVNAGQTAAIALDALTETPPLRAEVAAVSEYPLPSIHVYMQHIKEYAVDVDILNPPAGLRPGMTAEVRILIQRLPDVVQVPIQSVIERCGQVYCGVKRADGSLEARIIQPGPENEEFIVVESGLEPGEQVLMNIRDEAIQAALNLPEDALTDETSSENSTAETAA